MSERTKKSIRKAVDEAFEYYQSRGYDGHRMQPQIIEESKQFAEEILAEEIKEMRRGSTRFDYRAAIATYLACESRGCPINLRMANDSSSKRIKIGDLNNARKITGVEPKLKAEDWIDGVVRTLKNKNIISDKQESEIIEKTVSEIPKVQKRMAPRYKAITATYNALKNSGIKVSKEDIHDIFNITGTLGSKEEKKLDYVKIKRDVVKLFRENPETLYKPEDLIEILKLETTPKGLKNSLSRGRDELGILNLSIGCSQDYFGFSNICGSGYCYKGWCEEPSSLWSKCRIRKKNTKLKFYSKI